MATTTSHGLVLRRKQGAWMHGARVLAALVVLALVCVVVFAGLWPYLAVAAIVGVWVSDLIATWRAAAASSEGE